ncbi:MAG TPA: DUF4389 domain-containing protein [Actinophytocola sp.]|uniref:DUF4389 domain-containing protein n=1 Tax=Actinophytocola sp. TaxID=1872138 RepID=UPI002DBFC413|nr:DUF4389 domain-containing protein [Actinophytocola sp.]HEU5474944.1 DUF4389 domain-containing protein [Actinophytocola sp.]
MTTTTSSAIRLDARLDEQPSRGLWLVKWLLLIPHFIVLSFLWLAFTVLTVVVFFAILFSGRYPRSIFEFNVGVLRWTWRVWYYGYGALATDRYPPFSLGAEPDYPATLDVAYPERLSRGLVLVKWWLLALPHYLVLAFFIGSGFVLWRFGGGLITLLAVIAGVVLLFTGRYPREVYDLVLGMDRWVFRVGAYTALMTDEYPPFRLDTGGTDPAGPRDEQPRHEPASTPAGWTAGRVTGVVVGALLLVTGLGAAAGGGTLLWFDSTQRDAAGYVTTGIERFTDPGYALRFDAADVVQRGTGAPAEVTWLGQVRVQATGSGTGPLFVGIGRTEDVNRYLAAVPHGRFDERHPGMMQAFRTMAGIRPPAAPTRQDFWVASTSGATPLSLTWNPQPGNWSLVVMNADAGSGVRADLDIGATAPFLGPVAWSLLGVGVAFLVGGSVLVAVTVRPRREVTAVGR